MKSSISDIKRKKIVESLFSTLDEIDHWISGLEEKVFQKYR
jgi:hypothetical protein